MPRLSQVSGEAEQVGWSSELLTLVRGAGHLCLDVTNPNWDGARGYLFHEETTTLFFPVAKKYLPEDPSRCQVLIWSRPRVLLTGELRQATSEADAALQLALAERDGMPKDKAEFMLLDQRTKKARRTRYKLVVHEMRAIPV